MDSILPTIGALVFTLFFLFLAFGFIGASLFGDRKVKQEDDGRDISRRAIGMFVGGLIFAALAVIGLIGIYQI